LFGFACLFPWPLVSNPIRVERDEKGAENRQIPGASTDHVVRVSLHHSHAANRFGLHEKLAHSTCGGRDGD